MQVWTLTYQHSQNEDTVIWLDIDIGLEKPIVIRDEEFENVTVCYYTFLFIITSENDAPNILKEELIQLRECLQYNLEK